MHDRAMQALYLLALDPIAETLGDPNSYGFRPERSTADAIEQCFNVLAWKHSPQWIVEGDIRACFDEISHDWLLAHIPMETAMLRKWLQAGFIEKHVLSPTETGVPQGGICSPVIANLALDGLEQLLKAYSPPPMGSVLRRTPRREDDTHPQRPKAIAVPVETAKRSLSWLPPEDDQTHRMAQPSCGLAYAWGQGYNRQPCTPAPQLPQTGP